MNSEIEAWARALVADMDPMTPEALADAFDTEDDDVIPQAA